MSSPTSAQEPPSPADADTNAPPHVDTVPHTPPAGDPPPHGHIALARNPLQLPPIRTVLGEQLALPTLLSYSPPPAFSAGSHSSIRERGDPEGEETWSKSGSSTGSDRRSRASSRSERISPGETHRYSRRDASQPPTASPSHSAAAHIAALPPHALLSMPSRPHTPSKFPHHPSSRYSPLLPPALPPASPPFPTPSLPSSASSSFQPSPFSPHITLPHPTSFSDLPFPTAPSSPFPFPPATPHTAPPYLHVLRPSASGELITNPSIPRVRSRPGTLAAGKDGERGKDAKEGHDDFTSTRRHVCALCNKRFNRPSSLKTHQSVHTGSRPFPCPHKGCSKTFSVASNMRRHLRKHGVAPDAPGPSHAHAHSQSQSPDNSPDYAQESLASSEGEGEGDMDVETEEGQVMPQSSASGSASTSASSSGGFRSPAVTAASAPIPTGLATPGRYFEWTAVQDPEQVPMATAYEAGGGGRGASGPERSRYRSGSGTGAGGRRTRERRPRHASQ